MARAHLLAGAGGAFRLAATLPPTVAMELLLTGDPITAQQALGFHLVNRVVPAAEIFGPAADEACAAVMAPDADDAAMFSPEVLGPT